MHNFNINFIPKKKGVFIVGGTVRDTLLGRLPEDFDVAVTGDAEKVAEEIAEKSGRRVIKMGKPGKMTLRVVTDSHTYDITQVNSGLEADLNRRDFTVNAIAYDVYEKKLIDPLNGRADIDAGIVRMAGPNSFTDDPLRLLRAFRIAAALSFDIDPKTMTEIRKNAFSIKTVAGERIRDEWFRLIEPSDSLKSIEKIEDARLLAALFPELEQLKDCLQNTHHSFDVFKHTFEAYRGLEDALYSNTPAINGADSNRGLVNGPNGISLVKHAMLLHDIGKPAVRSIDQKGIFHFYGHEKTGSDMTLAISDRLCFSTAQKNYVWFMARHHLRPLFLFTALSEGRKKDLARARFFFKTKPFSTDLLLFSTADMLGKGTNRDVSQYIRFAQETIENYFNSYCPKSRKPSFITGKDLIVKFGLNPSPFFSEILEKLEIQRLAGTINSKEEALKAAEDYIRSKNPA